METSSKKKRRWTAFSIRGLLLLVLVVAVLLGWAVHRARQQGEAVAAIRKFGGFVHYDYEFVNGPVKVIRGDSWWQTSWGKLMPKRKPWAPNWLRRALGDAYFQEIAHVSFFVDIDKRQADASFYDRGPADDALAKLATQTHVRTLHVGGQQVNDANLASVGQLTSLEELILFPGNDITDAGVAHLSGLKNLRILMLTHAKVTDAGLETIGKLTNLEDLVIEGEGFSDRGLAHLRGLTRLKALSIGPGLDTLTDAGLEPLSGMSALEELDLGDWKVTDAGVETLARLKSLKTLGLTGTRISEKGRQRLKAALPGLTIE